jgi:MHS family proline/betaine transporter-like MFS transporter
VQAVALTTYTIMVSVAAAAADRLGRRPVLLVGCALLLVLSVPGFLLLQTGNIGLIILGSAALAGIVGLVAGPAPTALAEMFETRVRGFNLSGALFGGTAPFVATALIAATGTPLAPSSYLAAGAAVSLVVLLTAVRETVAQPLAR